MAVYDLDSVIDSAEAYLTPVLKKGTTLKTMDQLRSHKYHHVKRSTLEGLPPKSHSFTMHIKRSYVAKDKMVFLITTHGALSERQFGSELDDDLLVPSRGNNPIPEDTEIHCTCPKCGIGRSPCRRSGTPCCTFCTCQSEIEIRNSNSGCHNKYGTIK